MPLSHAYASPGVYTVSLTATDEGLEVSPPATAVIVVSSTPGDNISLSGGVTAGQVAISTDTMPATVYIPTDLVFVSGQGGNDTYTVDFGSTLTIPIAIAGTGTDTVSVNGSTDAATTNYIAKNTGSQTTITWGPSAGPAAEIVAYSGIPDDKHLRRRGQNYITDPGSNTTINGGPGPTPSPSRPPPATASSSTAVPSTNTYIVDLGSLAGPVTINNSNTAATNSLIVNGAAGNNTITASGNQVTSGSQTITDTAPLTNLTVNGGSGNNQITVSNLTVPVQNLALNGGGGNNTFTLTNAGADVGALDINGSGSGTNTVQVQGSLPANLQPDGHHARRGRDRRRGDLQWPEFRGDGHRDRREQQPGVQPGRGRPHAHLLRGQQPHRHCPERRPDRRGHLHRGGNLRRQRRLYPASARRPLPSTRRS